MISAIQLIVVLSNLLSACHGISVSEYFSWNPDSLEFYFDQNRELSERNRLVHKENERLQLLNKQLADDYLKTIKDHQTVIESMKNSNNNSTDTSLLTKLLNPIHATTVKLIRISADSIHQILPKSGMSVTERDMAERLQPIFLRAAKSTVEFIRGVFTSIGNIIKWKTIDTEPTPEDTHPVETPEASTTSTGSWILAFIMGVFTFINSSLMLKLVLMFTAAVALFVFVLVKCMLANNTYDTHSDRRTLSRSRSEVLATTKTQPNIGQGDRTVDDTGLNDEQTTGPIIDALGEIHDANELPSSHNHRQDLADPLDLSKGQRKCIADVDCMGDVAKPTRNTCQNNGRSECAPEDLNDTESAMCLVLNCPVHSDKSVSFASNAGPSSGWVHENKKIAEDSDSFSAKFAYSNRYYPQVRERERWSMISEGTSVDPYPMTSDSNESDSEDVRSIESVLNCYEIEGAHYAHSTTPVENSQLYRTPSDGLFRPSGTSLLSRGNATISSTLTMPFDDLSSQYDIRTRYGTHVGLNRDGSRSRLSQGVPDHTMKRSGYEDVASETNLDRKIRGTPAYMREREYRLPYEIVPSRGLFDNTTTPSFTSTQFTNNSSDPSQNSNRNNSIVSKVSTGKRTFSVSRRNIIFLASYGLEFYTEGALLTISIIRWFFRH